MTNQIIKELQEMEKLGMNVPEKAYLMAENIEVEYMSVSECADLCIELSY